MIFLDSDVFLIDLRYRRDRRFADNDAFLAELRKSGRQAVTSIFNILEVCGVLSFNLNERQLAELYRYLPVHYSLRVYPGWQPDTSLPRFTARRILEVMGKKASLGDALVISAVLDMGLAVSYYVSWNARHFAQHLPVPAVTPAEALARGILG